jgi:hypothetical protein
MSAPAMQSEAGALEHEQTDHQIDLQPPNSQRRRHLIWMRRPILALQRTGQQDWRRAKRPCEGHSLLPRYLPKAHYPDGSRPPSP